MIQLIQLVVLMAGILALYILLMGLGGGPPTSHP